MKVSLLLDIFLVSLTAFGMTWPRKKKTVIKDMKGDGGIVGMTQNKSALLRWSMTKHTLAAYSRSLQDRTSCGVQSSQAPHQEASPAFMKRDEELLMHFEQNMTDPFEVEKHPPCLLNVSSGMLASKEVQESPLTALNQGYAMLVDFLKRSFDSNTSGRFYKPIPKSKLKSYPTMSCKAKSDTTKGSAGHVNPEILFRRALLLSHNRPDVSLETVLSYPIGPVPISLFHEDGWIRKTNKSELATQLETHVKREHTLTTFEGPTILLRDAMGIAQCMDGKKYKTFGDLAMGYLNSLLNCFSQSKEVVDVFDRYDVELSIKGTERKLRAQRTNCTKVYQVLESRGLPDLKKFLAVEENKRQLLSFLGSFVEKVVCMSERVPNGKTLYMTGAFDNPDIVKKFTTEEVNLCEELGSTQEEVDTRIILHLINIDSSFKRS
ncbi:hypothetical protein FSP39_004793 [Pinctada imbricata]|uniref:Uncharacterized protein n=1 Tax=Pinctada imbricata TaxID=66713 RepID=A0AA89CDS1_PINIB|nr:hypothetical protein FSP39_004793 [Pinctada imbricata]